MVIPTITEKQQRVVRAMCEIEAREHRVASIREIADHLGIQKATVHQFLGLLQEAGHVVRSGRGYALVGTPTWVPLSVQPPEVGLRVLVTVDDVPRTVLPGRLGIMGDWTDDEGRDIRVVAWRRLPGAYEQ